VSPETLYESIYFNLDRRAGGYLVTCRICHRSRMMSDRAAYAFLQDHPGEHSKSTLTRFEKRSTTSNGEQS